MQNNAGYYLQRSGQPELKKYPPSSSSFTSASLLKQIRKDRMMAIRHHHDRQTVQRLRRKRMKFNHFLFGLLFSSLMASFVQLAQAQSNNTTSDNSNNDNIFNKVGNPCQVNQTLLLTASNQLMSDCGYLAWCDPSSNTCAARGCRREEYPFGYSKVERSQWPKKCDSHQFCPDEGSLCMDKIALGGGCQLNRDDECATSESASNVRCLHNICTAVNASLSATCIHENVVYTVFTSDNSSYGSIVSRDNCMNGLYCDSPTSICLQRKPNGQSCSADKECMTDFCQDKSYLATTPDNNDSTGTCAEQPYVTVNRHQLWVYPVIVIVAIAVLLILIFTLLKVHQNQGVRRREKARAYWESQRLINEKARLYKEDKRQRTLSGSLLSPNRNTGSRLRSYGTAETSEQSRSPMEEDQRLLRADSPAGGPSTHTSYDATYLPSSSNRHPGLTESYPANSLPPAPGQMYIDHPGDNSLGINTTIAGMHGHQDGDQSTDTPTQQSNAYARLPNNHSNVSLNNSPRADDAFLTPSHSHASLYAGNSDLHDVTSMYGTPGHHTTMRNRENVARNAPIGSPDARLERSGSEWSFATEQRRS